MARPRSIVFVGNCQARSLLNLYRRFVAAAADQQLLLVLSYRDLPPEHREALRSADLIIEQIQDFKAKAAVADIETAARRVLVPIVNCGFLWPFAGQPHPKNPTRPYMETGVYGAEMSDGWLNRMIKNAVPADEALARYLELDVHAEVDLDRLYELSIDRQRRRDEAAGFHIAEVIVDNFRDEPLFRTPYHPDVRVAVALAAQLFEKLGVARREIDRMRQEVRVTPFPKNELPIHPNVCRHFGLRFVDDDRRWHFRYEGAFTFREFTLRYMHCSWNEPLEEGLAALRQAEIATDRPALEKIRDRLVLGLSISPGSAVGHNALANVLAMLGETGPAIEAARRATELDPTEAAFRTRLGNLLRGSGGYPAEQSRFAGADAAV